MIPGNVRSFAIRYDGPAHAARSAAMERFGVDVSVSAINKWRRAEGRSRPLGVVHAETRFKPRALELWDSGETVDGVCRALELEGLETTHKETVRMWILRARKIKTTRRPLNMSTSLYRRFVDAEKYGLSDSDLVARFGVSRDQIRRYRNGVWDA